MDTLLCDLMLNILGTFDISNRSRLTLYDCLGQTFSFILSTFGMQVDNFLTVLHIVVSFIFDFMVKKHNYGTLFLYVRFFKFSINHVL